MQLSKTNKDRINVWIKHFNITSDFTKWIKRNHKKVYSFIEGKYKNLNTKSGHLSTLAVVIQPIYKTVYNKYSKLAIKYKKENQLQIQNNQVVKSRLEHQIEWSELINKREQLKQNNNFEDHIKYLILCLYSYQAPIRSEYSNMKILYNKTNNNINYLNVMNKHIFLHINKDKVIKSHGKAKFKLNPELTTIIKVSLQLYPRDYILTKSDFKSALGYQKLIRILHGIFNKKVGIDIIRSAFVTKFYKTNPTYNKKIEIAKNMRSSIHMQETTYYKINNKSEDNQQVENKTFDLKTWSKKYRSENKQKINTYSKEYYDLKKYDINRKKLLRNIKMGNVIKPTQASINKYKLVFVNDNWA